MPSLSAVTCSNIVEIVNYTEGVYIDYRYFVAHNITPRFEFGYGLTYTTFEYSGLQASLANSTVLSKYPPGSSDIAEGGIPSLWDTIATVTSVVENTGNYTAAEVPQLYISIPNGPEKVLRGFDKVELSPGQRSQVQFKLMRRDLSTWDVVSQNWLLQSGEYKLYVGASVLDIRLFGSFNIHSF